MPDSGVIQKKLYYLHPIIGDVIREVDRLLIFPGSHYATVRDAT